MQEEIDEIAAEEMDIDMELDADEFDINELE
jgi:hypothetical protein